MDTAKGIFPCAILIITGAPSRRRQNAQFGFAYLWPSLLPRLSFPTRLSFYVPEARYRFRFRFLPSPPRLFYALLAFFFVSFSIPGIRCAFPQAPPPVPLSVLNVYYIRTKYGRTTT